MKNILLSIAVAIGLFGSFIYGVHFGRQVEHEAVVNATTMSSIPTTYTTRQIVCNPILIGPDEQNTGHSQIPGSYYESNKHNYTPSK